MADYGAKEVEDYSDDELEVVPTVKKGLTSTGSSYGLKVAAERSAKNLKELEEAEVRGEDVAVHFNLPNGTVEKASFPLGQDVGFLKCYLRDKYGFPLHAQVFTAGGRVMIDPLSLRDYDIFVGAKGPVTVEVKVSE